MYLMIDNYDSFVYNLKAYFEELGKEIAVIRCDKITLEEIEDMQPSGIILSPGQNARRTTLCIDIVEKFRENTDTQRLLRSPGARTLLWCNGGKRDISDPWENL